MYVYSKAEALEVVCIHSPSCTHLRARQGDDLRPNYTLCLPWKNIARHWKFQVTQLKDKYHFMLQDCYFQIVSWDFPGKTSVIHF